MEDFREDAVWVEWQEVKIRWWLPSYRIGLSVVVTVVANVLSVLPVLMS